MKRAALVVTILFALLAFGVGLVGTTVALDVTRPVVSGSNDTINFVVNDGDTSTEIANKLEKAGLIRNALIFRLLARYKHLDSSLQHGTYSLSLNMNMDQIITALEGAPVDEHITILVPPGLRVTQYPDYFTKLPNFNADNFKKIAQTGILLDDAKTTIWSKYWFVQPMAKGTKVKYALEGYLFPDTYYLTKDDDETSVIDTMLDNLGEKLCPGPDNNPKAYFADKTQCLAHAAKVGNTDIFSAMEKAYSIKDPVAALQTTLTLASLTAREIDAVKYPKDALGVTNVYFTRYMAVLNKTPNLGGVFFLGSDPTVLYALDSASPPKDDNWWNQKLLVGNLANLAKTDPYNTYVVSGLPPGPIAAPLWADIEAAANPGISKYFYFIQDCHGTTLYATTLDQHNANIAKAQACK
ncbi:MAG TPA: endolytic transglycosylase MltG [Ktedonobacterales bacterium]|nr:endolytic transglycosylase MltG [Ktedonobacterales bacterium]